MAEEPSLSYYLPIAGGRIIGFIPFPRVLVLCEMQSVSSRIELVSPCSFPTAITTTPRARFQMVPEDFTKHICISHRPVFKTDEQTTTNVRPVFNCFLKTNGKYSLNEAAYLGTNLMGDVLDLLQQFKTNKYVILADIRKAFLMIKLRSLKNQNRFCFFMKEGNKLVCFRHTTIILVLMPAPSF